MLGGSVGAVGGCRRLESSVVYVFDVGEVRIDVGGLVGVGVLVLTVGILLVLKSVGSVGALVVDVPNGAVGGSRESERCWRMAGRFGRCDGRWLQPVAAVS